MNKILSAFEKNGFSLKNHVVMAPMTRSRAINNIPNDLMTTYYGQRTGAGLIITEGTAPSPEALGYPRIPGIFSDAQVDGWKNITKAVHNGNSKIFLQIMHTGRIGHYDNLPPQTELVGVSNIKAAGQIHTDSIGKQDHSAPTALTTEGIKKVIEKYVAAAKNAMRAGFDGVEIHGANGYLLEQFLNPNINNRNDEYGGSIENRARLTIEVVTKVVAAIGKEKVGIRFSPFSTLGDLQAYDEAEVHETYYYLAAQMNRIGIQYIHISANPNIPLQTFDAIRSNFSNTIILSNGLTPETAEAALSKGFADIVAFGRSFLATPDFVTRIEMNAPLNELDFNTLYTADAIGYTDYPTLS
ncbi:alkene reductase [Arachidicoccus soli]|uniref:Alkene reductase n=1 Tax=Arachidicoccus soli TaxID=2341117 RepID=A0A386HPI8_9BACT|nr:alkene reductase [Arachidicoccus soli]AYD47351.1 alkene reductase [Arachidicoccus soli]AYD48327.1 alkene reductase [Arachidicoccus soli]